MRAVIQRTLKRATVEVDGAVTGEIARGLVVYLGIEAADTAVDIEWVARKIVNMRIFSDEADKMNLALGDIDGGVLVISQFTLFASTKKGNRPSYMRSAPPDYALAMYEQFVAHLRETYPHPVGTGVFAADMKVSYVNDGPVTILLDSQQKE